MTELSFSFGWMWESELWEPYSTKKALTRCACNDSHQSSKAATLHSQQRWRHERCAYKSKLYLSKPIRAVVKRITTLFYRFEVYLFAEKIIVLSSFSREIESLAMKARKLRIWGITCTRQFFFEFLHCSSMIWESWFRCCAWYASANWLFLPKTFRGHDVPSLPQKHRLWESFRPSQRSPSADIQSKPLSHLAPWQTAPVYVSSPQTTLKKIPNMQMTVFWRQEAILCAPDWRRSRSETRLGADPSSGWKYGSVLRSEEGSKSTYAAR